MLIPSTVIDYQTSDLNLYPLLQLCEEFQKGVGKELQAKLHERARQETNWVSITL